ncbi:MAG: alpha-ketoacid dehydrogenase subunit beta [Actinomycetota bacterium]|nr:alpha-ketoacid dehydrogenase subunit beta [Actinomycetota bacterium]
MSELTYLEAIRDGIREVMKEDERVFLIGEDIGLYGGSFGLTNGLFAEFGAERVRDTPISEAAIIGASAGAAVTGMRPILEIMFSDFTACGMDQLLNQAAKIRYMFGGKAKVPMVLRTASGGGAGFGPHHSQSWEAIFAHIPGLKVVMPSCPYDAKGLLISAVRDNNPVIFLEHKVLYKNKKYAQEVPEGIYTIPLGKAEVKRQGKDLSIVASSYMVQKSLEAAEELSKQGIDCEVVDLRTIRPLDIDTVMASVEKTGKLLCVEEACSFGSFMGEVITQVIEKGFDYLDAPPIRIAGKNCPVPYSYILEQEMIPNVDRIKDGILKVLGKN